MTQAKQIMSMNRLFLQLIFYQTSLGKNFAKKESKHVLYLVQRESPSNKSEEYIIKYQLVVINASGLVEENDKTVKEFEKLLD